MPVRARNPVQAAASDKTTKKAQQDEATNKLQQEKVTYTVQKVSQCASEAFVPGGSNFLKGDWKQGSIHAVVGFAALRLIGPVGWAVTIADSLSKSQTGKHLYEHLGLFTKPEEASTASQS